MSVTCHHGVLAASCSRGCTVIDGRASVRVKMPSVVPPLAWAVFFAFGTVCNALAIATGSLPSIAFLLVTIFATYGAVRQYKARKIEREQLRERNLGRVEDWIINTDLPAPSDALAKREAEDARAYREFMAKQGKRPDGSQAPDPNSNRSKKRAARKARAAERRRERELEQDIISAMNVPPMILGSMRETPTELATRHEQTASYLASGTGWHNEDEPLPREDWRGFA